MAQALASRIPPRAAEAVNGTSTVSLDTRARCQLTSPNRLFLLVEATVPSGGLGSWLFRSGMMVDAEELLAAEEPETMDGVVAGDTTCAEDWWVVNVDEGKTAGLNCIFGSCAVIQCRTTLVTGIIAGGGVSSRAETGGKRLGGGRNPSGVSAGEWGGY